MFNESFCRSDPADYLRTRLQLLVLTGTRLADLSQLIATGVEYAGMRFGPAADEEPPVTADEPLTNHSVESFLTIESQTLMHHASETVLRLFLLHAEQSHTPCSGPFSGHSAPPTRPTFLRISLRCSWRHSWDDG